MYYENSKVIYLQDGVTKTPVAKNNIVLRKTEKKTVWTRKKQATHINIAGIDVLILTVLLSSNRGQYNAIIIICTVGNRW